MTDNERKELLLKAKPILFNTEMVRAILDDRKTVTRRDPFQLPEEFFSMKLKGMKYRHKNTYKSEDYKWKNEKVLTAVFENDSSINYIVPCRYKPGDILYVRETWGTYSICEGIMPMIYYKADGNAPNKIKWKPSIHMPKAAARIFIRVTDVRVERLKDIEDGWRFDEEGIVLEHGMISEAWRDFATLWDSTIKKSDLEKYGWDANPWVWVIEFDVYIK